MHLNQLGYRSKVAHSWDSLNDKFKDIRLKLVALRRFERARRGGNVCTN